MPDLKRHLSVKAIENGTVIDHIPAAMTLKVVEILSNPDDLMTIGINLPSKTLTKKGFVKIENRILTDSESSKIALFAPQAKVNLIENFKIITKKTVHLPERLTDLIPCNNPTCITNHEGVRTDFNLVEKNPLKIQCRYCERSMGIDEVALL